MSDSNTSPTTEADHKPSDKEASFRIIKEGDQLPEGEWIAYRVVSDSMLPAPPEQKETEKDKG